MNEMAIAYSVLKQSIITLFKLQFDNPLFQKLQHHYQLHIHHRYHHHIHHHYHHHIHDLNHQLKHKSPNWKFSERQWRWRRNWINGVIGMIWTPTKMIDSYLFRLSVFFSEERNLLYTTVFICLGIIFLQLLLILAYSLKYCLTKLSEKYSGGGRVHVINVHAETPHIRRAKETKSPIFQKSPVV